MRQPNGVTRRGVLGMTIAAGAGAVATTDANLTVRAAPVSPAGKRRKKPLVFVKARVTNVQVDNSGKLATALEFSWFYPSLAAHGGGSDAIAGLDPTSSAAALHSAIVDQVRATVSQSTGTAPDAIDVVVFGGPS